MWCAQAALEQLDLDELVIVPTARPPHRELAGDPGAEVRAEMCRAAVEGLERCSVSVCELDRPGPSYTVDTLRQLAASRPHDRLRLIVGADAALGFGDWHEPQAILALAGLAVAGRAGVRDGAIVDAVRAAVGADVPVRVFPMPRIDVSSTEVRARVAAGRSIRWLVPEPVAAIIARRRLYGLS